MGGVGGGDVRGDERTNDVGAAAAVSSTAIDLLDDRDKYGDDGSSVDGFGSDNDDVIDLLDDDPDLYLTPPNTDIDDDDYVDIDSDSEDASGTKPLTALWLYNMLSNCSNVQQLKTYANRYLHQLFPTDSHYLTKIANNKQYAAARCAMAPDIRVYGQSASSDVESMNRANKPLVREKTAVDPLNAAILLLKLEGGRFNKWKQIAWATDMPLTPKGMDLMKDAFNDVNIREGSRIICPLKRTIFWCERTQMVQGSS